jgi:hypothetical protein
MKAIILSAKAPIRRPPLRRGLLFIPLVLVCFGLAPMAQAVGPDTDGNIPGSNNGEGIGVLVSRTVGIWNTGTGFEALSQLTAGNQNTATGLRALTSDANGGFNTATGVYSLSSNTSGFFNSATGAYALASNISGNYNTANGYGALYRSTGDSNTANGFGALHGNTTGGANTATGYQALLNNTGGFDNVATGLYALVSNTEGVYNTAYGDNALFNTTGSSNIALGSFAGNELTTGNNNIDIGNRGVAGESDTIRIGDPTDAQTRTFIAGISGATASGGLAVYVNSNGRLGTTTSSARFKQDIHSMDKASETVLGLKPVTFRYKKDIDPDGIPQFGLVAEEVEKVNPDLIVRDKEGKPYSVRYDQVNAMLLNEFLKEHKAMQEQGATIAELKKQIATLIAAAKDQDSKIQKVSDQIEIKKAGPGVVRNNPRRVESNTSSQ